MWRRIELIRSEQTQIFAQDQRHQAIQGQGCGKGTTSEDCGAQVQNQAPFIGCLSMSRPDSPLAYIVSPIIISILYVYAMHSNFSLMVAPGPTA